VRCVLPPHSYPSVEHPVNVIDVPTQTTILSHWTVGDWANYFKYARAQCPLTTQHPSEPASARPECHQPGNLGHLSWCSGKRPRGLREVIHLGLGRIACTHHSLTRCRSRPHALLTSWTGWPRPGRRVWRGGARLLSCLLYFFYRQLSITAASRRYF
jgi:hypothetical protein